MWASVMEAIKDSRRLTPVNVEKIDWSSFWGAYISLSLSERTYVCSGIMENSCTTSFEVSSHSVGVVQAKPSPRNTCPAVASRQVSIL